MILSLLTLLTLLTLLYYHLNRNKYNIPPVGGLKLVKNNEYRDENGIRWLKRDFLNSLLHNPFKYYVFETYDIKKKSSSEVKILKSDFGFKQTFQPSSFNYFSSYRFPVYHFFTDVLPVILF